VLGFGDQPAPDHARAGGTRAPAPTHHPV